jgi:phosphonate transport system substrate-binding protein
VLTRRRFGYLAAAVTTAALTGCAAGDTPDTLYLGAIPDQDHDRLEEIYGTTAAYLSGRLGIRVEYRPVTDYAAAVGQFRTGDLDLVWFGGLTGVQAAAQVPGAVPLVQRDIDTRFRSLFLGSTRGGPAPGDLTRLAGTRFTYGSASSTSGYLMPAYHLRRAGVDPENGFTGPPGFSGSHDKTIDLVEAGSYQAGAVNEQVWAARLAEGSVDRSRVRVLWRTPPYHDYHWVLGPGAAARFGADVGRRIAGAFTALTPSTDPRGLLALYGCASFVPTEAANYRQVAEIGRALGLVRPS